MRYEDLPFLINPSLRLSSPYLQVAWRRIDQRILEHEAGFPAANRAVYTFQKTVRLLSESSPALLCLYYSDMTDFASLSIQQWLRRQIKSFVEQTASTALPLRLHEQERQKGLYCSKVSVFPLKRSILGYCTHTNEIALSPELALFPLRMSDAVMLHEMASPSRPSTSPLWSTNRRRRSSPTSGTPQISAASSDPYSTSRPHNDNEVRKPFTRAFSCCFIQQQHDLDIFIPATCHCCAEHDILTLMHRLTECLHFQVFQRITGRIKDKYNRIVISG